MAVSHAHRSTEAVDRSRAAARSRHTEGEAAGAHGPGSPSGAHVLPRGNRRRLPWTRVVAASAARGLLVVLVGLALWGAAPTLLGWHPTTVMTGSMEPRFQAGDVVVSRPVPSTELRLGQVLLFHDPAKPSELRLHRYVADAPGRELITKGDANASRDSTPVSRSAVVGVGFLRVPFIGLPIVWLHERDWAPLVAFALVLAALGLLSGIDGSLRREPAAGPPPGTGPPSGSGPSSGAGRADETARGGGEGQDARGAPGEEVATTAGPAPESRSERAYRQALLEAVDVHPDATGSPSPAGAGLRSRREVVRLTSELRRLRLLSIVAIVALVAGAATLGGPDRASAVSWTATTANPASTLTAATAAPPTGITCTNTSSSTVTISWVYSGAIAQQFDVINTTVSNSVVVSVAGNVYSATFGTNALLALGTANVAVRADLTTAAPAWQSSLSATVGVKVLSLVGLGAVQCA